MERTPFDFLSFVTKLRHSIYSLQLDSKQEKKENFFSLLGIRQCIAEIWNVLAVTELLWRDGGILFEDPCEITLVAEMELFRDI